MADSQLPKGLGPAGRALWRRIEHGFRLREDEIEVLAAACKVADMLTRLDEAMVDEPLVVPGSAGQLREHPLIAEARQQRALLARLLYQLRLPDAADVAVRHAAVRSSHGRAAARARWDQRSGA